jgi:hypothetical protein
MNNTFFYFLKSQPTLILRDVITSIQANHFSEIPNNRIKIIFIPTSIFSFLSIKKTSNDLFNLFENYSILNDTSIEVVIESNVIEIQIYKLHIFRCFFYFINGSLNSFLLFVKYFIFNLNISSFLKSSFRKVNFGDIAASSVFSQNKLFNLEKNLELIKESFRIIFLIQVLFNMGNRNKEKNCFFSILDFTYQEALLLRILPIFNFKFVETQDYKNEIVIIDNPSKNHLPWIARPKNNCINIDLFNKYYTSRLFTPEEALDYMWMGSNNNMNSSILLDNGDVYTCTKDSQNVVLFLHAFSDAAYCYDLDGFKDLMEWTTTTIDILINNALIQKILIKPHPNISFDNYPADQGAMFFLKQKYSSDPKVVFLDKYASLIALCKLDCIIGITRHGSVAEEMTFLNKPVIAYKHGPWEHYHRFLISWDNRSNYENLLSNLNYELIYRVPLENKNHLINYFLEYRNNSRNVSREWYGVLFQLCSKDLYIGNFENIKKFDNLILTKKINYILEFLINKRALNLN